jgi:hypothetical protein
MWTPSGNFAYLGLGFNDRDEAFNFKVALQDYDKCVSRARGAPVRLHALWLTCSCSLRFALLRSERDGSKRTKDLMAELGPSQDFSLKPVRVWCAPSSSSARERRV